MLRPIAVPGNTLTAHKDVPKSLILAASTGAEKTPVNTAQIFIEDRAEIYTLWNALDRNRNNEVWASFIAASRTRPWLPSG